MHKDDLIEHLEATGRNDLKAFERLYEATAPKLYSLALQFLSTDALAEEALQDAFVNIWREAHRYDARRAAPLTWMASIVRHRAIDELRRRKREKLEWTHDTESPRADASSAAADPQTSDPLEQVINSCEHEALKQCLNALEGRQKEAITLAFFRGLTHAELAQSLSAPLGSVKSWIRRGMEHLRVCLQQ